MVAARRVADMSVGCMDMTGWVKPVVSQFGFNNGVSCLRSINKFKLEAVRIGEEDGIIAIAISRIINRRIEYRRTDRKQQCMEIIDVCAAVRAPSNMMQSWRVAIMPAVPTGAFGRYDPYRRETPIGQRQLPIEAARPFAHPPVSQKAEHSFIEITGRPWILDGKVEVVDRTAHDDQYAVLSTESANTARR
jgi:hypothetical protein